MIGRTRGLGLVLVVVLAAACSGSPPDLGTVEPREPVGDFAGPWKLVTVEGIVLASEPIDPVAIEIEPDGRSMTVFFTGGVPECYGLTGVDVVRHDPDPPDVQVRHGLRLGVMGCVAALAFMATRVPLEPPFQGS